MPVGIENLKKIVKFSCDFTDEIAGALADGKFKTAEIFGFFDEIMSIPGVVKSFPEVMAEIKDLTEAERNELHAYVVDEFDIPNDKVEGFIEHSIMWAFSTVSLVELFKGLRKK